MMERSRAIKSPSIHYHLAGTKKVQQELAKPGQVERFLGDKVTIMNVIKCDTISSLLQAKISQVREIFTGLYSLDKVEEDENVTNSVT